MGSRRSFFGWMVAAAAAIVVTGGFEAARSSVSGRRSLRSEHARASDHVPPYMMVVVSERGKVFHVAGCPFIHDKSHLRTITAWEAKQHGYAPCIRCMKKYLDRASLAQSDDPIDHVAASDPAPKSD